MQKTVYSYIRFSSARQALGDSERRQIEKTKSWAEKNGYAFNESLSMADKGLSAYHGDHLKGEGELGHFVGLAEQGKIKPGSILVIEAMDRLTRQKTTDAYDLFMKIIRAGITIHTSIDGQSYSLESLNNNSVQLIISISLFVQANRESRYKSERLYQAWKGKRKKIEEGYKLSASCPFWLKLSEDQKYFIEIPEAVRVVKRIFDLKLSGMGSHAIMRQLNDEKAYHPKTGKKNRGWYRTTVTHILKTPAVIGEFQPTKAMIEPDGTVNSRKRVLAGEPVKDYFPQIIPEETFYRVQQMYKSDGKAGGKTGKLYNLFGHMAYCGFCGSPMAIVHSSKKPKIYKYFICDKARRNCGCKRFPLRYEDFENEIIQHCRDLNIENLLNDENKNERYHLESELIRIDAELKQTAQKIVNLADSIADTEEKEVRKTLEIRLSDFIKARDELEAKKQETERNIRNLSQSDLQGDIDNLKAFLQMENSVENRLKIRQGLRNLIDKIIVFPAGNQKIPVTGYHQIALKTKTHPHLILDVERNKMDDKNFKFYVVHFKTGIIRLIVPDKEAI